MSGVPGRAEMPLKGSNNSEVPDGEENQDEADGRSGFESARRGSIRKVLHSLVGNDSLLGKSAKMLDRPKTKFEDDAYSEYFREYAIISEYNLVGDHLIPGLYTIPAAYSPLIWFGVLFVRTGIYKGGIFRFKLIIPEDFPDLSPPSIVFERNIFHPAVDPNNNSLNINLVFSQWSKTANKLWQVLEYCHSIFHQIPIKFALNVEAAQLYEKDRDEFISRASECVKSSITSIFTSTEDTNDPHYIRFSVYSDTVHKDALKQLTLAKPEQPNTPRGLSWVQLGSLKPCSRPHKT